MRSLIIILCLIIMVSAKAGTIESFSKQASAQQLLINKIIYDTVNVSDYRAIKTQIVVNSKDQPDYLLAFLLAKKTHRVDVIRINLTSNFKKSLVIQNYHLTPNDNFFAPVNPVCPDTKTELIVFAPNDDDLEQYFTKVVGDAGEAQHLKVVRLLHETATRKNYLDYMVCPNLKGNFYDGDSNPQLIITADGYITATEIQTYLKNKFRYKTINIWLACQAYKDPMLTAVETTAQSQKYAAGISDLDVGPSDITAACAMRAAIQGKPVHESFDDCYKRFDNPHDDKWGFGGAGSDKFGE